MDAQPSCPRCGVTIQPSTLAPDLCPACLLASAIQDDGLVEDDGDVLELDPGSTFGPFRIVRLLGRGGMASVYEAHELALERRVALKVLPPAFLHDRAFAQRFGREARLLAGLEHSHIVPIYASGIDQGIPWVSMRLLSGGTVSDLIAAGPIPPTRVVTILRGVAQGVDFAHRCGVIHRDIKPSNIVLDERGVGCLVDFGIARLLERDGATTVAGAVAGTPQYMSPEQARGQAVDHRCDFYSLGVVAYEMLTGSPPFTADSPMAVLMMQASAPPPKPSRDRVPSPLVRVLQKALAKNPDERWPTATAFVDALEHGIARSEGWQRLDVGTWGRRAAVVAIVLILAAVLKFVASPQRLEPPVAAPETARDTDPSPSPVSAELPRVDSVPAPAPGSAPPSTAAQPASKTGTTVRVTGPPAAEFTPRPDERTEPTPPSAAETSLTPAASGSDDRSSYPTSAIAAADPATTPYSPVHNSDMVSEAAITSRVDPIYPSAARAAELQGDVLVGATCERDGRMTDVKILRSIHRVLDEAAVKAVAQYTCEPRRRNGMAEASPLEVLVAFRLK